MPQASGAVNEKDPAAEPLSQR